MLLKICTVPVKKIALKPERIAYTFGAIFFTAAIYSISFNGDRGVLNEQGIILQGRKRGNLQHFLYGEVVANEISFFTMDFFLGSFQYFTPFF